MQQTDGPAKISQRRSPAAAFPPLHHLEVTIQEAAEAKQSGPERTQNTKTFGSQRLYGRKIEHSPDWFQFVETRRGMGA